MVYKIKTRTDGGGLFSKVFHYIIEETGSGEKIVWKSQGYPVTNPDGLSHALVQAEEKLKEFSNPEIQAEIQEIEDIKKDFNDFYRSSGGTGNLDINIQ